MHNFLASYSLSFFYLHAVRQRPPVGKMRVVVAEGLALAARNSRGIFLLLRHALSTCFFQFSKYPAIPHLTSPFSRVKHVELIA